MKILISMLASGIFLLSCSNQNDKMTKAESDNIINEVSACYDKLSEYSSKAQLDFFMSYYDNSPDFLSISADGKRSDYQEFKKLCGEYYSGLEKQTLITTQQKLQIIEKNLVIVSWTGNITAYLKNGDTIKMNNYSITSLFKKTDGKWKIIYDHESALPPEIIKNE